MIKFTGLTYNIALLQPYNIMIIFNPPPLIWRRYIYQVVYCIILLYNELES